MFTTTLRSTIDTIDLDNHILPSNSSTPRNETHEYKNGKWYDPKSVNTNAN